MFETTRRHLYLAGFMGTGKTAIGRAVAAKLGWGFIDLDEFIISICNQSIPEIFANEGEVVFRDLESRALRLAVISPHSVISLGGGTPIRRGNASIIRATGRCWLLTADLKVIWERVRSEASRRPLLSEIPRSSDIDGPSFEDFRASVEPLIRTRNDAYAGIADFTVDTSVGSIEKVSSRIVDEFNSGIARGIEA